MLKAYDRLPSEPVHNHDYELGLLGVFLMDSENYLSVSESIRPEYFHHALNREIFEAIKELIDRGKEAEPMVVANLMRGRPGLTVEAIADMLLDMQKYSPTKLTLNAYVEELRFLHERRALAEISEFVVRFCSDPDNSDYNEEYIPNLLEKIDNLTIKGDSSESETCAEIGERISRRINEGAPPAICDTGFLDVDNCLGGFREEWFVVLAGRPGMGKSLVAGQIASNVAQAGKGVIYISLEMSHDQMGERLVIGYAAQKYGPYNVPAANDIYKGEQKDLLQKANEEYMRLPIVWERGRDLSMSNIKMRINRAARRLSRMNAPLSLIVIDHLGLIKSSSSRKSKYEEISDISNDLKGLAARYSVPILALSQLSREVEKRADKRPILSDLRESGHIEQDADVVIMVYRDAYYAEREDISELSQEEAERVVKRIESKDLLLDIAKNRHGPVRPVTLWCDPSRMYATNKAPDFRRSNI